MLSVDPIERMDEKEILIDVTTYRARFFHSGYRFHSHLFQSKQTLIE